MILNQCTLQDLPRRLSSSLLALGCMLWSQSPYWKHNPVIGNVSFTYIFSVSLLLSLSSAVILWRWNCEGQNLEINQRNPRQWGNNHFPLVRATFALVQQAFLLSKISKQLQKPALPNSYPFFIITVFLASVSFPFLFCLCDFLVLMVLVGKHTCYMDKGASFSPSGSRWVNLLTLVSIYIVWKRSI